MRFVGLLFSSSHSGVLRKWLKVLLQLQPDHSSFMIIKHIREIPTESPPVGTLNTGGV